MTEWTGGGPDGRDDGYVGKHYAATPPPAFPPGPSSAAPDAGTPAQSGPWNSGAVAPSQWTPQDSPRTGGAAWDTSSAPWSNDVRPAPKARSGRPAGCLVGALLLGGLPLLSGIVSLISNLADDSPSYTLPDFSSDDDSPVFGSTDPATIPLPIGKQVPLVYLSDEIGTVTLRDVVVDVKCDEPDDKPVNGHFVGLRLTVEVAKSPSASSFTVNPFEMTVTDPEGDDEPDYIGNSYGCIAGEGSRRSLPTTAVEPGEKITGWVVLDISEPGGVVHWDPRYDGTEYTIEIP